MAVTLRFQRHGKIHKPFYHLVAADSKKARNGRFIEKLGYYDPSSEPSTVSFKTDRIQYWYGHGAQLSSQVAQLLKVQKVKLERNNAAKGS